MRNKDKNLSNPFRNHKHFPYGGKKFTGYGGEIYAKNEDGNFEERCGIVISKSKERKNWKRQIEDEIYV